MHRLLALLRLALLAAAASLAPAWAHASSFLVSVDTSSIVGSAGLIDFQFNPFAGAPDATATISNFGGATLGAIGEGSGVVSGALPGNVTLGNGSGASAYLQPVTFETGFSFRLDVSLAAGGSAATTFALGIYDNTFGPLLAANEADVSLVIDFAPGEAPFVVFAPDFIQLTSVEPIPEPATYALMLAGLAALLATARRRRTVRS